MRRVAGCDPGTSSLDVLVVQDGVVGDQARFAPETLRADPAAVVRWLSERGPFDLIAGPSGYGLPLLLARDCTDRDLALAALVRPDERQTAQGVSGFSHLLRVLRDALLPVVFLPAVIHLPTVPEHRKVNRIDLGTADKLAVTALALWQEPAGALANFCLVELGTAFSACIVVVGGQIVDDLGGTSGPAGWKSGGAWDGEMAYLFSPFHKADLFAGGVAADTSREAGLARLREALTKAVAALQAVTPFRRVVLSGQLLQVEPAVGELVATDLQRFGEVVRLRSLEGAWVKEAAQGAALLADGLAGGKPATLIERLQLRQAAGTILDWLRHPRASEVRRSFQLPD
jgi:predicted butyrate kinase (DUF1464 family)